MLKDLLEEEVLTEHKDLLDPLDFQVLPEVLEIKDSQVLKDHKDPLDQLE